MDKLKVLITVLEKQMLKAAEVGCPRLAALVQGAAHKLDLSPFAKQISQSLVKVILGTNEENIQIAKKAFQTMIKSCKDEDQLCKGKYDDSDDRVISFFSVADYLKAVYGGKEGKITPSISPTASPTSFSNIFHPFHTKLDNSTDYLFNFRNILHSSARKSIIVSQNVFHS